MNLLLSLFRLIIEHIGDAEAKTKFTARVGKHVVGQLKAFGMSLGGSINPYTAYKRKQYRIISLQDFSERVKRHFSHDKIKEVVDKVTEGDYFRYAKERLKQTPIHVFKQLVGHDNYNVIQAGINKVSIIKRQWEYNAIIERIQAKMPFIEGIDFGSTAIQQMIYRPSMATRIESVEDANAVGTCEIRFKQQRKQGYYTYYNVKLKLFVDMLNRKGKGGHINSPAGAWSYFMTNSPYFENKIDFGRDRAVKVAFKRQVRMSGFSKKQRATAHKVLPITQTR